MKSQISINKEKGFCTVHLDSDLCEEETRAVLEYLEAKEELESIKKYLVIIPEKFQACEEFRIKIHRILMEEARDPEFKIAVVTTLMKVVGYERFARKVTNMVQKEQIFERKDEALAWLGI